ncbi:MAG: type II toxin-antitoxin system RelE/ParE family toxin [bacterium]|uniref:Type II toxin-antitoxin system RelE/ParE family toxin n=1 Tax=Candidatus Methylomirabilis tolerans TaxID=3123416 RepID=A0AAJ1AIR6_9BACT|nr:type II toxin-antitoxin system RelE/ParE family toxin [Candidatus Methylomirabilis sp.]
MKRFGVEWAQPASKDLENIIDYISQDNVDTAITIFEKIKSKCSALNQFPDRGRIVPELKAYGILSYRELIVSPWDSDHLSLIHKEDVRNKPLRRMA